MRTLLITGPGGAGRTTVAVATARAAALRTPGRRVLLVTEAPAEAVGALLGDDLPAGLSLAHLDPDATFREELGALQERGTTVLNMLGARPLQAEELTALPGAEQFALLRALRRAAESGAHDLVVVDLPPLHRAVALLALPEQLRRYLRRLLPPERQAARALRPVLAQLAGVPMPAQWLYETAARWDEELAAVQAVVEAPGTAVRIVAEPGPAAADAVRAGLLGLALHQVPVDAVLANRVLPRGSADTWLAALAAQQDKCLDEWTAEGGPGHRVHELPHLGQDPRGAADLDRLAPPEAPAAPEATAAPEAMAATAAVVRPEWPVEDRRGEAGVLVWRIPLPGATKDGLDLVRRGDELLLTAGPFRRIVTLPSALRRCTVSGAALRDGELAVRFTPDPALWPRG
ncbi:ArsA family ATPase [Streptomyces sp. NRRL S-87]|uniref:ArsA family ATPase n=1 Tax=Streptomyces sp. NRRL S-87 TaxID=1463920 RepID=UPI0004C1FD6D|nr:ArsA-related P-loop ATPase [Streptomyces sp. NRRL S-87]